MVDKKVFCRTAQWKHRAGRREEKGELAPWKGISRSGSRMYEFLCLFSAAAAGIHSALS